METPDFQYEIGLQQEGLEAIAGVDEVGRGALAGPIVAAAVVFANYSETLKKLSGVNDSKKLTEKDRMELAPLIQANAWSHSYGVVAVEEIEKFGIGAANILAFDRALTGLRKCGFALIDGRKFHGLNFSYRCLIKGETKSISIAAASILGKVYRDNVMNEIAKSMKNYDFASNKGYGTRKHWDDLEKFGPSIYHRQSFLGTLNNQRLF